MPPSGPHLFVHIPKTAGTSLRIAAERAYEGEVLLDYGQDAEQTSAVIRELVYQRHDLDALAHHLRRHAVRFIVGHVARADYAALFPPERVVAFLREPLSRVVAEWGHARRNYGYPHDLETFAREPGNQNRQSRMLSGAPLERLGFIGVSESYRQGLAVLNARFGLRLDYIEANVTPGRAVSGSYEIPPEIRKVIRDSNAEDLTLYARVVASWSAAIARVPFNWVPPQ